MSYILEALRKAERERSLGQVPSIELGPTAAPAERRRSWTWWLAGALLLNAAVLAGWLLFPRARAPVPAPEQAAAVTVPEPRPAPKPAVTDYLPPPITVVEEPVREPPAAQQPEPEITAIPPPLPAEPEVEPLEATVEEPALEAASEETPVAEEPPLLRDLPVEFRRRLPEMKIDAHFHTDVPGRSFVMINLRKYKPGERLAEGPQVVEIVVDGVVLSYQGQTFLLTP